MEIGGKHYAFLVPSSVFVELDDDARFLLDLLEDGPKPLELLASDAAKGETLKELASVGAVQRPGPALIPLPAKVPARVPAGTGRTALCRHACPLRPWTTRLRFGKGGGV